MKWFYLSQSGTHSHICTDENGHFRKAIKPIPPLFLRRSGSVLTVSGRLTYTSNRSMEIEVLVDVSSLVEPEIGQYRAVSAFFVFISLDKYNRVMSVPPLKVSKRRLHRSPTDSGSSFVGRVSPKTQHPPVIPYVPVSLGFIVN